MRRFELSAVTGAGVVVMTRLIMLPGEEDTKHVGHVGDDDDDGDGDDQGDHDQNGQKVFGFTDGSVCVCWITHPGYT